MASRWAGRSPGSRRGWPGRSRIPTSWRSRRNEAGTDAGSPRRDDRVDVAEPALEPGIDTADLGPPFPSPGGEPVGHRVLGRVRDGGHACHRARTPSTARRGAARRARGVGGIRAMVMSSPFVITLSDSDRAELTARAQAAKIPYRDVLRARIILACAAGISHAAIAADLGICDDTVRKWRRPLRQSGAGRVEGPAPARPSSPRSPRSRKPRSSTGVHPAGRLRAAAGPLVARRTGRCRDRAGPGHLDQPGHHRSLAGRRRDQALAAPVLDLPPRPRLRDQSRPGAGPVRPLLAGRAARRGRLRDQRRRKIPAPSPTASPPRPGRRAWPDPTGRVRVPPRRNPGLPRRATTSTTPRVIGTIAPTTGILPFSRAGRPGDDHRALRLSPTGVLDRRQRLLPRRTGLDRADGNRPGRPPNWSTCPSTRPGSTRSRSTSPSCNAKPSPPATSPASTHLAARILAFQHRYNTTAKAVRLALQPKRSQRLPRPAPPPRPRVHTESRMNPRRINGNDH